ncbi:hypothetical protein ACFLZC_00475 [Patescibacteria group bacterium]
MKNIFRKHFLFILLLFILTVYLGLKAIPSNSWDDWAFGSAQTMLTMRHWVEDGMIYSKFLFIPIGYSKIVQYFDEPEMRRHAKGTTTGELMENRLYYTHYPAGYLIPHGILAKIGFESRYWFRFLALLFSLSALILMYFFFCFLSNKLIAFLATLYYAGSTMFLGLADSLANQPIDDFFRFLILLLSVLAVRNASNVKKFRIYNIAIWVSYFLLASSSYDSTFFVFVWLVGLDIVTDWNTNKDGAKPRTKRLKEIFLVRGKKWLLWGSAPVLAFILQMAQNVWYLGWRDMWLDVYGSFKFRTTSAPGSGFFEKHIRSMFSPLVYLADFRARFIIPIISFLFFIFWKLKNKVSYTWPKIQVLVLLALAGFAYPFILSSTAYFPYQGRQMLPFVGLLLASSTILIFKIFKEKREMSLYLIGMLLLVASLWFVQAQRTYSYILEWPNNTVDKEVISFTKEIKDIEGENKVIFKLDGTIPTRHHHASLVLEYYMNMPIMSFKYSFDLVRDYKWLKDRSEYPFYSVVLTTTEEEFNEANSLFDGEDQISIIYRPDLNFDLGI